MSVVLLGSTSGSITLQEPAIAGSTVLDLPNTSGSLVVTSGAQTVQFGAGSASAPSITFTGDTNTGIFSPSADAIAFTEGGVESMRITSAGVMYLGPLATNFSFTNGSAVDISGSGTGLAGTGTNLTLGVWNGPMVFQAGNNGSALVEGMRLTTAGNLGIGTTNPTGRLHLATTSGTSNQLQMTGSGTAAVYLQATNTGGTLSIGLDNSTGSDYGAAAYSGNLYMSGAYPMIFYTSAAQRMRITSGGDLCVGRTSVGLNGTSGISIEGSGRLLLEVQSQDCIIMNRQASDGSLVVFRQANVDEGTISVSGTTVSYNGGHLSRWSQLLDSSKDDTILKGTVMSNLDEMCVWEKDGVVADNEQLNKMKVSDVEGDTNVAGVFVNWTIDDAYGVDDMNVAMTGDMIIRIAEGVTVQKGDLLMSAGDGTAKPQGDDIVRSKTIAKVTSNYVTCTYADGSYCVPCVLMAC